MKYSLWLGALTLGTLMACQGPAEKTTTTQETTEAVAEKGYQLYTVREALTGPEAIASTLKETKALGYNKLESFGYIDGSFLGMPVTDFNTTLRDAQLSSPSGHYTPLQLEGTEVGPIDTASITKFIEAATALNQHWIIIPWMSEAWRNAEGYAHLVDILNYWVQKLPNTEKSLLGTTTSLNSFHSIPQTQNLLPHTNTSSNHSKVIT